MIDHFCESVLAKTEEIFYVKFCKLSIIYEMQFQIEDGPACLCFCLFPKRSITHLNQQKRIRQQVHGLVQLLMQTLSCQGYTLGPRPFSMK